MNTTRPSGCPRCGSIEIVPVVHGHLTRDSFAQLKRGEIVAAGFGVLDVLADQNWSCKSCNKRWHDEANGKTTTTAA